MKHLITMDSLLNAQDFEAIRPLKRQEIMALKKKRTLAVGPFAFFYFECFETLWWQIQEMVRIEKGGPAQQKEEIEAYAPLLPQGSDWRATLMFEIPDAGQRRALLNQWGHIEDGITLWVDGNAVRAEPTDPQDVRTTDRGKTSAVHFLKFHFSPLLKEKLLHASPTVELAFSHAHYPYKTRLSEGLLEALTKDLGG